MKNKNIQLFIAILVIIIISLAATYAFLQTSATNNTATGQGGCFEVNYKGSEINNTSLKSTTDYTEGAVSTVTLSKNTNCDIYTKADIYLHTDKATTDAPLTNPQALEYKVMQGTTEVSKGIITGEKEDQLLATVPLTTTATDYKVYLWINSETSKGAYNGTKYSGYIYASSTQTSTIK